MVGHAFIIECGVGRIKHLKDCRSSPKACHMIQKVDLPINLELRIPPTTCSSNQIAHIMCMRLEFMNAAEILIAFMEVFGILVVNLCTPEETQMIYYVHIFFETLYRIYD